MKKAVFKTKKAIKQFYSHIAKSKQVCGCATSCCSYVPQDKNKVTLQLGYSQKELKAIPQDSNLALGCGNPVKLAKIKKGETVLDLGCGAGIDCFIAAKKVGDTGSVIGIDMSPQMIKEAHRNAKFIKMCFLKLAI